MFPHKTQVPIHIYYVSMSGKYLHQTPHQHRSTHVQSGLISLNLEVSLDYFVFRGIMLP